MCIYDKMTKTIWYTIYKKLTTVRRDAFDDELLPLSCEINRRDLLPPGSRKRRNESAGFFKKKIVYMDWQ